MILRSRFITLFLCCLTASAFSQDDKFAQAIKGLIEIGYADNTKPEESTIGYHLTTDTSKFWINRKISYCASHGVTLLPIDLTDLRSIKYITVKSIFEIRDNIYPTAELIELEFTSDRSASENSTQMDHLTPQEMECIEKAPWIQWRIGNRIYFIVTKATMFKDEIPKLKEKLDEKLN